MTLALVSLRDQYNFLTRRVRKLSARGLAPRNSNDTCIRRIPRCIWGLRNFVTGHSHHTEKWPMLLHGTVTILLHIYSE